MSTDEPFDPYRQWLGVDRSAGVDHYQLLGLPRYENDPHRIAAAADERMALIRRFQSGPRGRYTQSLLNELAAARLVGMHQTSAVACNKPSVINN